MSILIGALTAFGVAADAATLEIDWEFGGQADYYILYRNGLPVAKITTMSPATITGIQPALLGDQFTMAAYAAGTATAHSLPYLITPAVSASGGYNRSVRLREELPHAVLSGGQAVVLGSGE